MSRAEELLDSLTEEQIMMYGVNPVDEPHIVIESDKSITIPDDLRHIAVQGEHNIETVTFDCPRYWDGHDLSQMQMRIVYQRPDGHREPHLVENLRVDEADENTIHFDWTVSGNVTAVKGNISFMVCAKLSDSEGNREREWHTRLNQDLVVDEGMECSGEEIVDQNPDIIEAILVQLDDLKNTGGVSDEQIGNAVAAYLEENPIDVGVDEEEVRSIIVAYLQENPPEGGTITEEQIETAVTNYMSQHPVAGEPGGHYTPVVTQPTDNTMQVSFTPSKTGMPPVESVTVNLPVGESSGQPTEEQVGSAVSAYLDAHPEATTTVVDGSITPAKTTFLHPRVNNLIDVTKIVNGHQTANGIPAGGNPSGAGWTTDLIPVEPGKTYNYNGSTGTSGMWTSWFYDADTAPLSAVPGSPFVAPDGAAYVRITYMAQPGEVGLWEGSNPKLYDQGVQYHEFDAMTAAAIQRFVEAYPQLFRIAPKNLYKFLSTGGVNGTTGKIGYPGNMNVSDYIRITPGQQYVSNCFSGIQYAACYDANKNFIASFTDSTEKRWAEAILFFTVVNPAVRYIVVATSKSDPIETRYITPGDAVPESLDGNIVVMDDPALLAAAKEMLGISGSKGMGGQLTVGLGDSNTNAEVNPNNWLNALEALLGVTTINYGVSGETVVDMCARYSQMDASAQNIVVAAGVNDITKETPLGAVGDTTTATFYGALHVLLTGLLDRYPGKRILWITPINYGEVVAEEPYINAILTMCGRFAVPVVDMWHNGGPVSAVTEALSNLNTTDGLHFTTSAHAAIARRVAEQLQKM